MSSSPMMMGELSRASERTGPGGTVTRCELKTMHQNKIKYSSSILSIFVINSPNFGQSV